MQQDRLSKALEKGGIDLATHNRLLDSAKKKYDALAPSVDKASNAFSSGASQIKSMIAGYVGLQTVTKSIRLAIDAEQAAASFEVLTGSINNSNVLLRELRAFSDVSPLSVGATQDAAKTMLAFNVPLQDVMRNLKMLGDISLGNEERFKNLTLAFSQMSAAGRLSGQDLLQFVNAGFNPLQEISRKTGESLVELRDRMGEGAISSQEVTQAFINATSAGGKFNGMTDKLADTMGGKLAIAMADVEKAGISLGQAFEPLLGALTDGFNQGTSAVQVLVGTIEKGIDGLGAMGALVVDIAKNIASLGERGNERFRTFENWLDRISKRDEERKQKLYEEAYKRTLGGGSSFDKEAANTAIVSRVGVSMTEDFDKQMSNLQKKIDIEEKGVQIARGLELAAEGYNAVQIQKIMHQEQYLKKLEDQKKLEEDLAKNQAKAESDRQKEIENLKKASEQAFVSDIEKSLAAANQYFEKQRERDKAMREQITKGIGGNFEQNSAESYRFFADKANTAIGATAIPEQPTPGEDAIIKESAKQFFELQQLNLKQQEQVEKTKEMVAAIKENGFKRIR